MATTNKQKPTTAYMTKWTYLGQEVKTLKDVPECCPFYIYKITFKPVAKNRFYYFGSKQIYSITNPKISLKRKKELYTGKGSYKTRERKVKESNWKKYQSSSKVVQEKLLTEEADFEILEFFDTKAEMLLKEAYLITNSFLNYDPMILNGWVSVKQFKPKK